MTQRNNILQELRELNSTLVNVTAQNVYSVPGGYFDELTEKVLNRIRAIGAANTVDELNFLSPVLSNVSKQNPYTVPAGYFDGLAESAMRSIREGHDYQTAKEEIESLSPLLSGLKKQMPYSVPEGYFESNTAKPVKAETKVVSLTRHKWFRYAAAAMVIGLIALTGLLILGNKKDPAERIMVKVEKDVKKMNEAQKDNLADFLDAGMNGNETAQVSTDSRSEEVKELLQGISEEELNDFQQQTEDLQEVLMMD